MSFLSAGKCAVGAHAACSGCGCSCHDAARAEIAALGHFEWQPPRQQEGRQAGSGRKWTPPALMLPFGSEASAIHEGGHAVLAYSYGRPVTEARVLRDVYGSGANFVDYQDRSGPDDAVISVGGGEATRLWAGFDDLAVEVTSRSDLEKAARLLRSAPGDSVFRECQEHARDLLRREAVAVEAVADALLRRGIVTGDEVAELMHVRAGWAA